MTLKEKLVLLRLSDKEGFVDFGLKSPIRANGSLDKWQLAVLLLTFMAVTGMWFFTAQNILLITDHAGCQGCLDKYCPVNVTDWNYVAPCALGENQSLRPISSSEQD